MLAVSIMPPPVATLPAYMSNNPNRSTENNSSSDRRRPKLSIETSALSTTFGGLSRGVSGNPGLHSTTTPTTSNTYTNQWDLSFRPSPISRTDSPRIIPPQVENSEQPYQLSLPFGIKSILKNTPLITEAQRETISTSPLDSRRKVFFPQPKKVTFKRHLEDVIETSKYVLRHSDLSSSEDELSSNEASRESSDDEVVPKTDASYTSPPPAKRRRNRKDESQLDDTSRHENSTAHAQPRSDRKRRRWEWTIPSTSLPTNPISQDSIEGINTADRNTQSSNDQPLSQDDDDKISHTDQESVDSGNQSPGSSIGSSTSESVEIEAKSENHDIDESEISRISEEGTSALSQVCPSITDGVSTGEDLVIG